MNFDNLCSAYQSAIEAIVLIIAEENGERKEDGIFEECEKIFQGMSQIFSLECESRWCDENSFEGHTICRYQAILQNLYDMSQELRYLEPNPNSGHIFHY